MSDDWSQILHSFDFSDSHFSLLVIKWLHICSIQLTQFPRNCFNKARFRIRFHGAVCNWSGSKQADVTTVEVCNWLYYLFSLQVHMHGRLLQYRYCVTWKKIGKLWPKISENRWGKMVSRSKNRFMELVLLVIDFWVGLLSQDATELIEIAV